MLLQLVNSHFAMSFCPLAGRAFTFLLDEKSKQKNQAKAILHPAFLPRPGLLWQANALFLSLLNNSSFYTRLPFRQAWPFVAAHLKLFPQRPGFHVQNQFLEIPLCESGVTTS